jgi:hypothetical protein
MADQQKQPAPKKKVASIASLKSKQKDESASVSAAANSLSSELANVNHQLERLKEKKEEEKVVYKSALADRLEKARKRPFVFNLYRTDLTLLKKMYPVIGFVLHRLEYDITIPEEEACELIKKIYTDIQELKKGAERSLYSLDSQLVQLSQKIDGITSDIISRQRSIRKQYEFDLEQLYTRQSLDLQEIDLELSLDEAFDQKEDLDLSSSDEKVDARIEEIKKRYEAARLELEQESNKKSRALDEELRSKIDPIEQEQKAIDGSIQVVAAKYVGKWENELNRLVAILNPSYVPTYNKENLSQEFYQIVSNPRMGVSERELAIYSKAAGEKRGFTAKEIKELRELRGLNAGKVEDLKLVHIPVRSADYFEKAMARAKVSQKVEKQIKEKEEPEEKVVRRIARKARAQDGDEDEVDNQVDYEDEADEENEVIEEELDDDVSAQVEQEADLAADRRLNSIYQQEQDEEDQDKDEEDKKEEEDENDIAKTLRKHERRSKALLSALEDHQEDIADDDTNLQELENELENELEEDGQPIRYDSEDDEVDSTAEFDRFQPRLRFARYQRVEEPGDFYMTPEERFLSGGYMVEDMPCALELQLKKEIDTLRTEASALDTCYAKIKKDPATQAIISESRASIQEAISANIYSSYKDFIVKMLNIAREDKAFSLSDSIHSIQLIDSQRLLLHDYLEVYSELDLNYALNKLIGTSEELQSFTVFPIYQPYPLGNLRKSLRGQTTQDMANELADPQNKVLVNEFLAEFFEPNIVLMPYLITLKCFMFQSTDFRRMDAYLTIEQHVLIKEYTKRFPEQFKEIIETINAVKAGRRIALKNPLMTEVASNYSSFMNMPIHERLLKGLPLYDKINVSLTTEWTSRIRLSNQICKEIEDNHSYSARVDKKVFEYMPVLLLTKLREAYPTVSGHRTKHLLKRMLSCQSMSPDQYLFIKFFMHDPSTKDNFNKILENFHHVVMWADKYQSSKMTLAELYSTLEEWYNLHRAQGDNQGSYSVDHAKAIFDNICFVLDGVYMKQLAVICQEAERLPTLLERMTRYQELYRAKVPKEFANYFNASEITFLYDIRKMFLNNYLGLQFPVFGTVYDLMNIEKTVSYFNQNPSVRIDITNINRKVAEHYQEMMDKVPAEEMNKEFQFDMAYCIIEHNLKSIIKASEAIINHNIEIDVRGANYETMALPKEMTVDEFREYFFEKNKNQSYLHSIGAEIHERFPVFRGSKELKNTDIVSSAPVVLLEIQTDLNKQKQYGIRGLLTKVVVLDLPSSKPELDELVGRDETNYKKIAQQFNQLIDSTYQRVALVDFHNVFDQLCLSVSGPLRQLRRLGKNNSARSMLYVAMRNSIRDTVEVNDLELAEQQSVHQTSFTATLMKRYMIDMKKRSRILAAMVLPTPFVSHELRAIEAIDEQLNDNFNLEKVYQESPEKAIRFMEFTCDLIFERFLHVLNSDLDQLDRARADIESTEEEEVLSGMAENGVRTDLTFEQFVEMFNTNPSEFRFRIVPPNMKRALFFTLFSKKSLDDYLEVYRGIVRTKFPANYKKVKIPQIYAVIPTLEQIKDRIRHYLPITNSKPDDKAHRSIVTGRLSIDAFPALMETVKNLYIKGPLSRAQYVKSVEDGGYVPLPDAERDYLRKYIDLSSYRTQPETKEQVFLEPEILDEEEVKPKKAISKKKKKKEEAKFEDWYKPSLLFIELLNNSNLEVDGKDLVIDGIRFRLGRLNASTQLVDSLSVYDVKSLVSVTKQRAVHSTCGELVVIPDRIDPRFVEARRETSWYDLSYQPIQNYSELENMRKNVEEIRRIEKVIADEEKEEQLIMLSPTEIEAFKKGSEEIERAKERLAFMKEQKNTFPPEELEKQKEQIEITLEMYSTIDKFQERVDRLKSIQKNLRVYNDIRLGLIGKLPKNLFAQIEYLSVEIKRVQDEITLQNLLRENEPKKYNINEYSILSTRLARLTHEKITLEEYVPSEPNFIAYYEKLMSILRKESGMEDKVSKLRRIETEIKSLEEERKEVGYELFAIHKQERLLRLHTEFQLHSQNWMNPTKFFLSQVNRVQDIEQLLKEKVIDTIDKSLPAAVSKHYATQISIGPHAFIQKSDGHTVVVEQLVVGGIGYSLGIVSKGRIDVLSPRLFIELVRARYQEIATKQKKMLDYFLPSDEQSSEPSRPKKDEPSSFSGRSSVKEMLCDMCHKKIAGNPFMYTFNLKENELVTLCSEECSEQYNPAE